METTAFTAPQVSLTYTEVLAAQAVTASDPGGSHRGIVRRFLAESAGFKCQMCLLPIQCDGSAAAEDAAQIGHVVGTDGKADASKRNIIPGRVFAQCRECNYRQGARDLRDYPAALATLVERGAFPATFPKRSGGKRVTASTTADERATARAAAGFTF